MILLPVKEESLLRLIRKHAEVGVVELDQPVHHAPIRSGGAQNQDPLWNLKAIDALSLPINQLPYRPKIGVIDTGISSHRDLTVLRKWGRNFVTPHGRTYDDNGHGTHVAGIIAAKRGPRDSFGVARGFPLIPLKAFNDQGMAFTSDIIASIEYAIRHRIKILNMSFGFERTQASMHQAIRAAYQNGMIMVTAAGNTGRQGVDYPARYPETITVTSMNQQHTISTFSSFGGQVDLAAPGEGIISTWRHHRYQTLSGTSMAAAHVSGVIALLCARYPKLTSQEALHILKRTAHPLPHMSHLRQGAGVVQAKSALQYLEQIL